MKSLSLRQRIRYVKISCQPWKQYRGEINLLCVSGQCLFSNKGLPWDTLEIELRSEGWIGENESLWDILSSEQQLKRSLDHSELKEPFDETWTDEDYEYFYNNL